MDVQEQLQRENVRNNGLKELAYFGTDSQVVADGLTIRKFLTIFIRLCIMFLLPMFSLNTTK